MCVKYSAGHWGLIQVEQVSPLNEAYNLGEKQTITFSITFLRDTIWYRVQDGSPYIPRHNPVRPPSCAPSSLQISGIPQIGSRNTEVKYCDFPKNPSARAYLEKNLDKGVSTKIGKAKGMWFDRGSVKLFLESGTSGKTAQIEEKDEQADNVGEEAGTESP